MKETDDETRQERLATYDLSPDDIEVKDVVVGAGEELSTAELSTTTVEPTTIRDVRNMIGASGDDGLPFENGHVPSFTPTVEELTSAIASDTTSRGSPDEALDQVIETLVYRRIGEEAAGVMGRWEELMNIVLTEELIDAFLEVYAANEITIEDGGLFMIDAETNVLFASVIEMYGSAELRYDGNTKIDCFEIVGHPN